MFRMMFRFGRGLRFFNFVPSSVHGSRSGPELWHLATAHLIKLRTEDAGGRARFKLDFRSAYALLHVVERRARVAAGYGTDTP